MTLVLYTRVVQILTFRLSLLGWIVWVRIKYFHTRHISHAILYGESHFLILIAILSMFCKMCHRMNFKQTSCNQNMIFCFIFLFLRSNSSSANNPLHHHVNIPKNLGWQVANRNIWFCYLVISKAEYLNLNIYSVFKQNHKTGMAFKNILKSHNYFFQIWFVDGPLTFQSLGIYSKSNFKRRKGWGKTTKLLFYNYTS